MRGGGPCWLVPTGSNGLRPVAAHDGLSAQYCGPIHRQHRPSNRSRGLQRPSSARTTGSQVPRSSHLSLRRHLEQRRRPISAGDRLVARYAAALCAAAKSTGPVRFAITGLILTPVSVMARAIPADAAADDLAVIFDGALHAEGCYEAGSTPTLWYVNLVYFTGPVRAADELAAWTEARQQMKVTDVGVAEMQIVRWHYTTTGMMPVVLASASAPIGRPASP